MIHIIYFLKGLPLNIEMKVHKKDIMYRCCLSLTIVACVFMLLPTALLADNTMKYSITKEWDSTPISHPPVQITLSWKPSDDFLTSLFEGPFFDDPPAPSGPAGKPFPKLWDYEVAEIFFLAPNNEYLEVEVSPHGQHLLLLLNGTRNAIKNELPMQYKASISSDRKTWRGTAQIPLSYLPHGVSKMNAYAIHGSGDQRVYESLYSVPKGKYTQPDFHRLNYFEDFKISDIVEDTKLIGTYWDNL